ncbi:hypothetical protein [Algoriphagus taiwanensis]|uniref:SH3 domain-containing protein n=1 Tax=Algoriphagus taiwanensis TaxID=1445656 RepID=A0ABQ6PYH7_9BACT|nr:hypothetical protein Ataiwa_12620 [Algoriphagus taiwanensis]
MAGIDDIIKASQLTQNIHKSLGLSSQLSEMLKFQQRMTSGFSGLTDLAKILQQQQQTIKSLSGISMLTELTKGMQQHDRLMKSLSGVSMVTELSKSMQEQKTALSPTFLAFDALTKSMKSYSNFGIPQTTLDAITSINRQHEQLFGGIRAMTDALRIQSPAITQINSLHFALGGISGHIAALAAQQKNWTIIEDFEEVTEKALDFTETLTEEVTKEQQRQFQVLLTLVFAFLKKHKVLGVSALLIIDIFLRFADIHQYYDFLKDKPESATKADLNQISIKQDSVLHFINLVNEQFKQANEYRITNRACEVKLKPKLKTLTLARLPKDFELIVVQIHHKWVFVSYFDPIDNLPQTGWILKKYLDKP